LGKTLGKPEESHRKSPRKTLGKAPGKPEENLGKNLRKT